MLKRDIRWENKTLGRSKEQVIPRDYKDNNDPKWKINRCLNCTETECLPYGKCPKIDKRRKRK